MKKITPKNVLMLLSEVRPENDFSSSSNFLNDELLDSFDLISLVGLAEKYFDLIIDGGKIVPENFCDISSIVTLLKTSETRHREC